MDGRPTKSQVEKDKTKIDWSLVQPVRCTDVSSDNPAQLVRLGGGPDVCLTEPPCREQIPECDLDGVNAQDRPAEGAEWRCRHSPAEMQRSQMEDEDCEAGQEKEDGPEPGATERKPRPEIWMLVSKHRKKL